MKRWTMPAALALIAGCGSACAGGNLLVSEVTGVSPGSGAGPIPVQFARIAASPTYTIRLRILFDPAAMTLVNAQGRNSGTCVVDQQAGYITLEIGGGGAEILSGQYCEIDVVAIAGGLPNLTQLTLDPVVSMPDFSNGGCFDAADQPTACMLVGGGVVIAGSEVIFRDTFEAPAAAAFHDTPSSSMTAIASTSIM
jgi:hypothetical protein